MTKMEWRASYPFRALYAVGPRRHDLGYIQWLAARLEPLSFFASGKGHMGTGALHVQEGDQLCVIFGCSTPMILRPDADGTYQVVGSCYMYDLAPGVAVHELKEGALQTTTFRLR
jgi:hypothetical protein